MFGEQFLSGIGFSKILAKLLNQQKEDSATTDPSWINTVLFISSLPLLSPFPAFRPDYAPFLIQTKLFRADSKIGDFGSHAPFRCCF
jgi:hypothetical protein